MQWTNEWIEKGRALGLMEARQEGKRIVLARVLHRCLGLDANSLSEQLAKLSSDQLDELADAVLDFKTAVGAQSWLAQRA